MPTWGDSKDQTMIHKSSCNVKRELKDAMYSKDRNAKLVRSNRQTYYLHDFYDDIKKDFPNARPCKICKPKSPT